MAKGNSHINAGVHNSNGIEFQKHCALYILFERYTELKDRNYFICIEHYDDVLFCHLSQTDLIAKIDAYQAKKSSTEWGMGKELTAILKKLTQTGLDLLSDPHPKEASYTHELKFVTNHSIKLHCGTSPKTTRIYHIVNESSPEAQYLDVPGPIQDHILKALAQQNVNGSNQVAELDKLALAFIDLPKQAKKQKEQLIGQFHMLFGDSVKDPKAAVDTLLLLFRDAENVINSGNTAKLMDTSKRVTSNSIKNAIQVITTKTKAYDFWRTYGDELSKKMAIPVFDRTKFKLAFDNSFDFFKDIKQAEHRKLLNYLTSNVTKWAKHFDEIECINDMYASYIAEYATNLNPLELKAATCAAYLEIKRQL